RYEGAPRALGARQACHRWPLPSLGIDIVAGSDPPGRLANNRSYARAPTPADGRRSRRTDQNAGMKERMLGGELYVADDPELLADHARAQALLERYNATRHVDQDERDRLLRELLGEVGEGVVIKPSFRCDYGIHISTGARTSVNSASVMLDVAPIRIGASCQIATRVQLLTATHPVDPEARRLGWEYGKPITIGDNVWLGGGVIVCPGVT